MSPDVPTPPPEDPVLRDDALLDALRRGEPPSADDPVAALLAEWRAEVVARAAELDEPESVPGPVERPSSRDTPAADTRPDPTTVRPGGTPAGPASAGEARPAGPDRSRPRRASRRHGRVLAGATLTLVTLTGGLWLGAARAEPGGLLWPVTELVWTERAESLVTEREIGRTLEQAHLDLTAGRYADAHARLERATALLAGVVDDEQVARFRANIDDLRRRLPVADPTAPPPDSPTTSTPPAAEQSPGAPASPPPTVAEVGDESAATAPAPSTVEASTEQTQQTSPAPSRRPGRPAPGPGSGATTPATDAPPPGRTPADPGSSPVRPGADRPTARPGRSPSDRPTTGRAPARTGQVPAVSGGAGTGQPNAGGGGVPPARAVPGNDTARITRAGDASTDPRTTRADAGSGSPGPDHLEGRPRPVSGAEPAAPHPAVGG